MSRSNLDTTFGESSDDDSDDDTSDNSDDAALDSMSLIEIVPLVPADLIFSDDDSDDDSDDESDDASAGTKRGAAASSSRPRQRRRTRGPVHYDEWKRANRGISSVFHNASHGLKDALDIFIDFRKTSKIPFEIRLLGGEHETGFIRSDDSRVTIKSGDYRGLQLDGSNTWSGLTIVYPEFRAVYTLSGYSVRLSNDIETIGEHAFYECSSLASVAFPDALQTIGDVHSKGAVVWPRWPFRMRCRPSKRMHSVRCSSLASVVFPDALQTIGEGAFSGCSSLASVAFPDALQTIGERAFYECSSLASVVFPDALQTIGSYAFDGCSSLASVAFPDACADHRRVCIL